MYTKEQEERVLAEFERTGSATITIRNLGYPSLSALYRWFEHKKAGLKNNHGHAAQLLAISTYRDCTEAHPRYPSVQVKLDILHRCFEIGEDVEYVSRETGYSRASIYKWRRKYLEKGSLCLMPPSKTIARKADALSDPQSGQTEKTVAELQEQISDMQLEIDMLKETINVLKKDPGVDMT